MSSLALSGGFDLFLAQLKEFSRKNSWVFVVLVLSLGVIFVTERGRPVTIAIIFLAHFLADLFVMMMAYEYSQKRFLNGAIYQICSTTVFTCLTVHAAFFEDNWQYVTSEPIYILAGLKNYYLEARQTNLRWINVFSTTVLSLMILAVTAYLELVQFAPQWIQMVGVFMIAVGFSTTRSERLRYSLSLFGLSSVFVGTFWEIVRSFVAGEVIGLTLSYMLLPLTVLVVYFKLWPKYFGPQANT